MKQLTILTFVSTTRKRRYKQLPQCVSCRRKFSENEFSALEQNGHNIVWNIDYAKCQDCGAEVQGWLV